MNDIMNISGIECYEKDGTAYLKLETVYHRCHKWQRSCSMEAYRRIFK